MLYKGPDPKAGITLNGKDILDYDPFEISDWINSLPDGEREIIQEIIRSKMVPKDLPLDYAKAYGRPSLEERPYMTCENDGYSYLPGHAPNCNGSETYSQWPLSGPDICWCAWIGAKQGSEAAYKQRQWEIMDMDG